MNQTQKTQKTEGQEISLHKTIERTQEFELHVLTREPHVKLDNQEFIDEALDTLEELMDEWHAEGQKQDKSYCFFVRDNVVRGTPDDYIFLDIEAGDGDDNDHDGGTIELYGWKAVKEEEEDEA